MTKQQKSDFEALAYAQCSKEEIKRYFNVSDEDLQTYVENTYGSDIKSILEHLKAVGRQQIRKKQLNIAERNPEVAQILGQQYLQQLDDISTYTTTTYKNKKHRPPYLTIESLQLAVDEYIEYHEENNKIMTINGLACFLGFSASLVMNWPKDNQSTHTAHKTEVVNNIHYDTIQYAIMRIAMQAEERAIKRGDAFKYLERVQGDIWQQEEKINISNTISWGEYDKDL